MNPIEVAYLYSQLDLVYKRIKWRLHGVNTTKK